MKKRCILKKCEDSQCEVILIEEDGSIFKTMILENQLEAFRIKESWENNTYRLLVE